MFSLVYFTRNPFSAHLSNLQRSISECTNALHRSSKICHCLPATCRTRLRIDVVVEYLYFTHFDTRLECFPNLICCVTKYFFL